MLKITAVSLAVKLIFTGACVWKARKEGRKGWVWGSLGALLGLWALLMLFAVSRLKRSTNNPEPTVPEQLLPQSHWFYANSDYHPTGPISLDRLQQIIKNNELGPQQLIWHPSYETWKPVKEIPGLMSEVRQP